jgi:protein-tyrosine phosphatase
LAGNLSLVQEKCPPQHLKKVGRFTEFCQQFDSPVVPDPYYGGAQGFENVLDLIEDASEGLLRQLKSSKSA